MNKRKLIIYITISIISILIISGIYLLVKKPEDCYNNDRCEIVKSCESNSDCIKSCGCSCVSEDSVCPPETIMGICPMGGFKCGCLNNTCTYDVPSEFD